MYKRTIAALFTGLAVFTAPCTELEENGGFAVRAYAETSVDIPRLLNEAYRDFLQDRTIGKLQQEALLRNKEQLLPFLQAGISLSENREDLFSGQGDHLYQEWSFWLELARQMKEPRVEPYLLSWLAEKRPIPDPFLLGEALDQTIKPGNEERLLKALDGASQEGAAVLLSLLEKRKKVSDQQLNGFLVAYTDKPQENAIIGLIGERPDGTNRLKHLYKSSSLSEETKRKIMEQILISRSGSELAWLKEVAANTEDPATEQLIDRELVRNHGDKEAAKRLHENGLKHGFFYPLDGLSEKYLSALFPTGKLHQGIAAYEQIRGFSYFHQLDGEEWYSYQSRGKDFAQPQQAVNQWLIFIQSYPHHPALDDAAYRLARCYQLLGRIRASALLV